MFFEITYTSDLAPEKASYNSEITFTSNDPLVITTGLKIDLAITNQPAIVPVISANFNQVGSITDLSAANGKTRLYVNNTGSSELDASTITIPSQYTVLGNSCPASLKVGKTCFYDLTINPAQTSNSVAVIAPIEIGSTSFLIKAGDPVIVNSQNPISTCKNGFTLVNNFCEATQISCSIADATSNGVDFARSNNTVQGLNVDGDKTACLLADNACDISSTLNASKKSCDIKTFSVTINKLLNQASVVDTTLGKINCSSNCTTDTQLYDYGSMIVLSVTAEPGFTASNWSGCDSVSGNNCIINSLTDNRIIAPVLELQQLTLSTSYANAGLAGDVNSLTIYKNGAECSGACLNSFGINDIARIVVSPNLYINVDSFTQSGSISALNTSVLNEVSFMFQNQNVSSSILLSYKDFATQPEVAYSGGTLTLLNLLTKLSSIDIITSNSNVAREMLVSTSADCSSGSYEALTLNKAFSPAVNQTSNLSVKYKNGDKYSQCFPITITHDNIAPVLTNAQAGLISNGGQITLLGSCENSFAINFSEPGNTVNTAVICSGGTYSKPYTVSTGSDGNKTITVSSMDSAGNESSINVNYNLDKTLPTLSLNILPSIITANASLYEVSGNCSELNQNVNISFSIDAGLVSANALCNGLTYSTMMNVSTLADGQVNVAVSHSDLASNVANLNSNVAKTTTILEPAFSGRLGEQSGGANSFIYSVAKQSDGKTLIAGGFTAYNGTAINRIARLNSDGSLDSSFNPGVGANSSIKKVLVQSDGKILIGGLFSTYNGVSKGYIARLNSDGSLDTGFNNSFGADNTINTIALQSDGKILIGGDFQFYDGMSSSYIARLNSNGSFDPSFSVGTGFNNSVNVIAVESSGNILVAGSFWVYNEASINTMVRLDSNGTLDLLFNPASFGVDGSINAIAFEPDGKIVIGGNFASYSGTTINGSVTRLYIDGTVDSSFSIGTGTNNIVNTLDLQSDGKIIIGGNFTTYNGVSRNRIARLNNNGSIDTGFVTGTGLNVTVNSLVVHDNGKIAVGGNFTNYNGSVRNYYTRLNSDATLDTTTGENYLGADGALNKIAIQSDGKIVIGGSLINYNGISRNRIARINSNGGHDTTFNPGTGASASLNTLAVQSDGKIVIAGLFTSYNGSARNYITRVNSNGTIDTGFVSGTGLNVAPSSMVIQSDGKIIVAGDFTTYNGSARSKLVRINSNGSIDTSFNPGTTANGIISSLALQSDGKIIIVGGFTTYAGIARNRIARLNSDGTLDTTFTPGLGANNNIFAVAIQSDGKILIGGNFSSYNSDTINRIARINNDGLRDATFAPGGGANASVNTIAIQDDGRILIGGSFTSYNSNSRNRISRINTNGSFDSTFNPGTGAGNSIVNTIAIQSDGKIIVGGGFLTFNNAPFSYIVRLQSNGSLE